MLKLAFFLFAALITPALAAPDPSALARATPQEALRLANAWRGEPGVRSHVTSEAVHVTFPNGRDVAVNLPRDRMVVAIAPYLRHTHPCRTHVMSGCDGELKNTSVRVHVATLDGRTVLRKTMKTLDNGFLEVWLPRSARYRVTLSAKGKTALGVVSTAPGADTCVTTFHLR